MYGNKADNLFKLKEHGINVPTFEVLKPEDINDYTPAFESEFYAVRSSCSLEDGKELSFAGQFATFLNVGKVDLKEKIKECFNSMNDNKIKEYLGEKSNAKYSKTVIVQQMINSDLSGVIFTANPQGLLNEAVITCGKGTGNYVVEDKEDTTTYYYNLTDEIYYYEGSEDYLSRNAIKSLIELAKSSEKVVGKYLDIEFAIKDKQVFILQARNITTIDDTSPLVLDNSNIVESYPGVSLPLTISFVNYIYSGVFKSAISRILKNEKEINKLKDVFNNMVGCCNGRLYYKISNWYEIVLRLPFSKKILPIWQEMLGLSNDTKKYKSKTNLKVYINFLKELKAVPTNMELLNNTFTEAYKHYKSIDINSSSHEKIIELYKFISNQLFPIWDITLFNDMYTFIYTGFVKNNLKKKYKDYEKITNNIISSNKNIESLKPIKSLIELSKIKDAEEYETKFKEYIENYGDRCVEELKLETKTFRTNPELLEEKVREFSENQEKFDKLLEQFGASNNDIEFDEKTKSLIEKCKAGIKNREMSRLNRTRIFGMCREMFLRIGEILTEKNVLDNKEDVFYLNLEEVLNVNLDDSIKINISERKEKYRLFYKLPGYSKLIFTNDVFDKSHLNINNELLIDNEEELRGIPSSGGVCEGEAYIVDGTTSIQNIKDKIIITKMTDPGWVFMIANAKGIISEKGSILSHTAIITRELKIPSIVGVKNLLKNVKTGDKLYMDANTGIIKIIK